MTDSSKIYNQPCGTEVWTDWYCLRQQERCCRMVQSNIHAGQYYLCMWSTASESENIWQFPVTKEHQHTSIIWWHLMLYPYKIQLAQMFTAAKKQQRHEFCWAFLQFVLQYPGTLHCLWFSDETHFPFDEVMNKYDTWFLGLWKFSHHSTLQNAPCCLQSASKGLLDWSSWRAP